MTEIIGGVRYELDRIPLDGATLLTFKIGDTGHPAASTPLAAQAQALERLLARQIQARALPEHVEVRFADTKDALVARLQAKLQAPGADWDSRLGRPIRGVSGEIIQAELAGVVGGSPLTAAFPHCGYRLHLTAAARIEIGRSPARHGVRLPVEIDEMDFAAGRAS